MRAIVADGLGKRYGRRWALRDCTLAVPDGSVVGLVGANGAGKSTFLHLTVGLLDPSEGQLEVLGGRPGAGAEQLGRVGFVAQDAPVYGSLSVEDHLRFGAHTNPAWDAELARRRVAELGLDLGQRAGRLSGGQRSQLALTLAMAKRPELLVLDEPVASLDPLARRAFLADVMDLMVQDPPTVVLSSHLLSDVERICDHLIVMVEGQVAVEGPVDAVLARHKVLTGPRRDVRSLPSNQVLVQERHTDRQTTVVVRTDELILDPTWVVADLGLEELVLAYMAGSVCGSQDQRTVGGRLVTWLAWRQARAQVLAAAATLAVVVGILLASRGHVATTATEDLSTFYESLQLLGTALVGVPAAIGAFWGAPLLARELENGTHRLAWTQGVTRRRWLGVKLLLLGLVAAALTAVFSLVFTWWSRPFDEVGNRIGSANFGQRGIAPVAYALFALALGTLVGAIARRTLPAMAITLAAFFVARFSFQLFVRPHLLRAVVVTRPSTMFGPGSSAATDGAWVLSSATVDKAGHPLPNGAGDRLLVDACHLTRDSSPDAWARCVERVGLRDVVKVHPASQFWTLQLWESLAFGGMTIALVVGAFWWIRHRTA